MRRKVLIGPSTFAALDPVPQKRLLDANLEVIDNPFKRKLTKDELLALLPGVIGLIAGLEVGDRGRRGEDGETLLLNAGCSEPIVS